MATHFAVQALATLRNQQAELLVDYVLRALVRRLYSEGQISAPTVPELHKQFSRDDCSDIFDHYVHFALAGHGPSVAIDFWAQTTCYKGNELLRPEPNKVYEIRETLVEGLGLRRWLREEGVNFRTLHFTIGPASYAYGWIRPAKANAFDLSLFPPEGINTDAAFIELQTLVDPLFGQDDIADAISKRLPETKELVTLAREWIEELYRWFTAGLPRSDMADKQADLMTSVRRNMLPHLAAAIAASELGGEGIKDRVTKLLNGGAESDRLIIGTATKLVSGNPFLEASLEASSGWRKWVGKNLAIPPGCTTLRDYLKYLWTMDGSRRLLVRRLLLRIRSGQPILYVADIGIRGLSEHNLYGGDHTIEQLDAVTNLLLSTCQSAGVKAPIDLFKWLESRAAASLSATSRQNEIRNGTGLKPSFMFVQEAVKPTYNFIPLKETGLPRPVPYHSAFSSASAQPYSSLAAVVRSGSDRVLSILKVKYFRPQEFPRRAKEETYVGLTTRYAYDGSRFTDRYPGVPMGMFVDMPAGYVPPAFAVTRLLTAGWRVFFSLTAFREFLDSR